MITNDYNNLRDEIMYSRKAQDKFAIFLYTTVATIIGFAINFHNAYLFLLPLLITLPFSLKIADYRRTISNLAAYMIVFLENKNSNQWETDNYNIESDLFRKKKMKISRSKTEILIHSLENYDSFLISVFCTGVFMYYKIKQYSSNVGWNAHDVILTILSILICVLILIVCIRYSKYQKLKEKRIEKWRLYKALTLKDE